MLCIYIYIYTHTYRMFVSYDSYWYSALLERLPWRYLRGECPAMYVVNQSTIIDRSCSTHVHPGTCWARCKSRLAGVPNKSLCQQKHEIRSGPISADPICPQPRDTYTHAHAGALPGAFHLCMHRCMEEPGRKWASRHRQRYTIRHVLC